MDDLSTVLSRSIETTAEYDLRLLARQLGTNYRSLMYWLRGDRHISAYVLPQICGLLKNFEALDSKKAPDGPQRARISLGWANPPSSWCPGLRTSAFAWRK